jgi:hypothetical protein
MRLGRYTFTVRPEVLCGESGWTYAVSFDDREVFGGWSRGSKGNALDEIREGIRARESLRSAVGS